MSDQQAADGVPTRAAIEAENETLRTENAGLRERVKQLEAEVAALEEHLGAVTTRVAELEQGGQRRGKFGKAARTTPGGPGKPRRARAVDQNRARPLDPPTAFATHQYERCPDCDYPLRGGSVWWKRQVVDLPPPPPVVVTQHPFIRRWCPVCRCWCVPPLPADLALGQGRLGLRVASLVATLRTMVRLPIGQIQVYLETVHGLHLSRGGIVDLLRRVATVAEPAVSALQTQAQASPMLHMDETGWREDGQHGYVWLMTTPGPEPVCYFERDRSRSHAVFDRLRGPTFAGHLVTDFYAAYNSYAGKHQRCWVHLLRDLHDLKEQHPHDAAVCAWARSVHRLYDRGIAFVRATDPPTEPQRQHIRTDWWRSIIGWGCAMPRPRAIPARRWRNGCCGMKRSCSNSSWCPG